MTAKIFLLDDETPARARMRMLLSDIAATCPNEIVGEAAGAQDALDAIMACSPDIVLLDVQMPGLGGIEFARHLLQNMPLPPMVIFVSAHDMYALQAFEVQAFDYLLKPVRAQRLQEALLRAVSVREKLNTDSTAELTHQLSVQLNASQRQYFSVLERGRILLVPVKDVIYIKAEQKYLTLYTVNQSYLIEEALQAIESEMPAVFVRIHRNTLIARLALTGVERGMELDEQSGKMTEAWQAILRDCKAPLPISRRAWPTIKALVK